jgi:hypothetical protein
MKLRKQADTLNVRMSRPLAHRQLFIPPYLLLALCPLPHRQALLEHGEGEALLESWTQRPLRALGMEKFLSQSGRALIELDGNGSREVRFGSAEPWIHVKDPTDLPLITCLLNDYIRFLVIAMNKAGLKGSMKGIPSLRNNLFNPLDACKARASARPTASCKHSMQLCQ